MNKPNELQSRIDMREAAYEAIAKWGSLSNPKEQNLAAAVLAKMVLALLEEVELFEIDAAIAQIAFGGWHEENEKLRVQRDELKKLLRFVMSAGRCKGLNTNNEYPVVLNKKLFDAICEAIR